MYWIRNKENDLYIISARSRRGAGWSSTSTSGWGRSHRKTRPASPLTRQSSSTSSSAGRPSNIGKNIDYQAWSNRILGLWGSFPVLLQPKIANRSRTWTANDAHTPHMRLLLQECCFYSEHLVRQCCEIVLKFVIFDTVLSTERCKGTSRSGSGPTSRRGSGQKTSFSTFVKNWSVLFCPLNSSYLRIWNETNHQLSKLDISHPGGGFKWVPLQLLLTHMLFNESSYANSRFVNFAGVISLSLNLSRNA